MWATYIDRVIIDATTEDGGQSNGPSTSTDIVISGH